MGKVKYCLGLAVFVSWTSFGALSCGNIDEVPEGKCQQNGGEDCPCHDNGVCDALPDGTQLVCEHKVCVVPTCDAQNGLSTGCLCGANGACRIGLVCINGNCAADSGQTLSPPADPRCYTPCRGGYTDNEGQYVPCSDEGLLAGCIGETICVEGSCLAPSPTAFESFAPRINNSCQDDSGCPTFQTCIENKCYSDCERDAHCRSGRQCVSKVCRLPCQTATDEGCPSGEFCSTQDGISGFCFAIASGNDEPFLPPLEGSYSLSSDVLAFSNNALSNSFTIVNDTPVYLEFVVRKLTHTEFDAEGSTRVDEYPLAWLTMGDAMTATAQVQELIVGVDGDGGTAEVMLADAANPVLPRWEGVLEVSQARLGIKTINLSYTSSPEGQWAGQVYYFANFGTLGLEEWLADRSNRDKLSVVGNAFIRRWGALREGRITLDEFHAMRTATLTGSWNWKSVQDRCPNESAPNPNAACYLYSNELGISVYSDYLPDNPIPTGLIEFPMAINLHAADPQNAPGVWSGKIDSRSALQYAGNPQVNLVFASNPNDCSGANGGPCIIFIDDFESEIFVGGRYLATPTDTSCAQAATGTFRHVALPWLVPGFAAHTDVDSSGNRYRYECRDKILPFGNFQDVYSVNASLAASNPIPDGTTRRRRLELIDGAIIDQKTMLIVFKEYFPSFLDPADTEGFSAYGFMELVRTPATLAADAYEGSNPTDVRVPPTVDGVTCEQDMLDDLFANHPSSSLVAGGATTANAEMIAGVVVKGIVPSSEAPPIIGATDVEQVHYVCEDTGLFDGGSKDDGGTAPVKIACPAGSRVEYFTVNSDALSQAEIAALPCQATATCVDALTAMKLNGTYGIRWNIVWRCQNEDEVYCDSDRLDLRNNKEFFADFAQDAVVQPLDDEIEQAFRYKTKFRSRTGASVGFAPQMCIADSDEVPYCYDPATIESIRQRVDCAAHLYTHYYGNLTPATRTFLRNFLVRDFSYGEEFRPGLATPIIHDGFERLYAELMVMMGDEAYVSAFKSRFDLAGMNMASFEGSLFEPGGINLSGGAGYEMFSLYLATQYYQQALDRLFSLSPIMWQSIGVLPPGQGYVSQATVVSYFTRLIRASAQKTRAFSEISKRYQSFNRPDLARFVIERAYTSAYLESIILSRLMLKVVDVANPEDVDQIKREVEMGQITYRMALLDMRNVFSDISDRLTFFGFAPDYVPFPTLDPDDTNAFDKVMERAVEKLAIAADKEQRALTDDRSFETDSAMFQAELAAVTREYEGELSSICGSFEVRDGTDSIIYPAIPKYAYLNERAALVGDPCGFMGNGEINDAIAELEIAKIELEGLKMSQRHLKESLADKLALASEQCGRIGDYQLYLGLSGGAKIAVKAVIDAMDVAINLCDRLNDYCSNMGDYASCSLGTATSCPMSAAAGAFYSGFAGPLIGINTGLDVAKGVANGILGGIELAEVIVQAGQECVAINIDTKYAVKDLVRQSLELQLQAIEAQYGVSLTVSKVQRLRHEATSLMSAQEDATSLMLNVEAARNDPNTRIYRNDAIINADRTFSTAIREAYRATKVYEYYTSQSYAALDKLFLIRMVEHGDYSLEGYLADLQEAFVEFEELYGLPDTRVEVLSLRDDILAIPEIDADGVALSDEQRTILLREGIQNATLLDPRGYISVPFSTTLERLSPLTRNHKILYMEAEIVGEDVGDDLGRVYVQQRGTGIVRNVDGEKSFFAFPNRTAVINTYFNGTPVFDETVYRNERLRDRPLVNTGWELVFNRKDEHVNTDVLLDSLTDIRLFFYYTDFTEL